MDEERPGEEKAEEGEEDAARSVSHTSALVTLSEHSLADLGHRTKDPVVEKRLDDLSGEAQKIILDTVFAADAAVAASAKEIGASREQSFLPLDDTRGTGLVFVPHDRMPGAVNLVEYIAEWHHKRIPSSRIASHIRRPGHVYYKCSMYVEDIRASLETRRSFGRKTGRGLSGTVEGLLLKLSANEMPWTMRGIGTLAGPLRILGDGENLENVQAFLNRAPLERGKPWFAPVRVKMMDDQTEGYYKFEDVTPAGWNTKGVQVVLQSSVKLDHRGNAVDTGFRHILFGFSDLREVLLASIAEFASDLADFSVGRIGSPVPFEITLLRQTVGRMWSATLAESSSALARNSIDVWIPIIARCRKWTERLPLADSTGTSSSSTSTSTSTSSSTSEPDVVRDLTRRCAAKLTKACRDIERASISMTFASGIVHWGYWNCVKKTHGVPENQSLMIAIPSERIRAEARARGLLSASEHSAADEVDGDETDGDETDDDETDDDI